MGHLKREYKSRIQDEMESNENKGNDHEANMDGHIL